MSDIAIRVENLSKLYHIGRAQQRHDTLRDAIADFRLQISDLTTPNRKSKIPPPFGIWSASGGWDLGFDLPTL